MGHFILFTPQACEAKFWESGEVKSVPLPSLGKVEFSEEKRCIGHNDGERMHPCPIEAEGKRQCGYCASRDISRMYTRLDVKGLEAQYSEFKNQEFSIYLASFGSLVKCGITRRKRLVERTFEQGCDCYCEIAHANDADTAYALESAVHSELRVRSAITMKQKIRELLSGVDGQPVLEHCMEAVKKSGILQEWEGELKITRPKHFRPEKFQLTDALEGKILGTKGQLVFFERNGATYAIPFYDKPGRIFSYSLTGS
jgi:hypothetical protein